MACGRRESESVPGACGAMDQILNQYNRDATKWHLAPRTMKTRISRYENASLALQNASLMMQKPETRAGKNVRFALRKRETRVALI